MFPLAVSEAQRVSMLMWSFVTKQLTATMGGCQMKTCWVKWCQLRRQKTGRTEGELKRMARW